jgi:hypothetical protein
MDFGGKGFVEGLSELSQSCVVSDILSWNAGSRRLFILGIFLFLRPPRLVQSSMAYNNQTTREDPQREID